MRQIVLDTETTGLSIEAGHRIIEVGCLELVNRRRTGHNYHVYIQPDRIIEPQAEQVHGITNSFLSDKPKFETIAETLWDYLDGAELIIHNAPFDVGFLNHEFGLCQGFDKLESICRITDSLMLARDRHPGQKNNLDALCKRYQVDNTNRSLHGALIDADLLAVVYLAMTGGQVAMAFDMDKTNEKAAKSAQQTDQLQTLETPVVHPSAEERQNHEAFVDWMRRNYGHCLWDEV